MSHNDATMSKIHVPKIKRSYSCSTISMIELGNNII